MFFESSTLISAEQGCDSHSQNSGVYAMLDSLGVSEESLTISKVSMFRAATSSALDYDEVRQLATR